MSVEAPRPEATVLPSGLRVVTCRMPGVATASLAVVAGAGSRDEHAGEHGLAHFLEHMAFKGTRRRSAMGIAAEIEAVGGDINAATSTETTAFTARLLERDVTLGLDVLSDIISDSVFDPKEIRREKGVILQEIAAVDDAPDDLVFDVFTETAYPDQPIGRPILGTARTVRALDQARLQAFLRREYGADRIVVAAAGAVDHDLVAREADRRLSQLRADPEDVRPAAAYAGGERRMLRKLEQAHVVFGFEAPSYRDPSFYAAQVFAGALGGGMSSRLFQEVREKRGLAYAVYAFQWGYSDTGLFGVYFGAGEKTADEALAVSLDCCAQACQSLTEEEVERAKAQVKVSLLAALESSGARADQMARHLLAYDRLIPADEIAARVSALTADDVKAVGMSMLAGAPTMAAIGPVRRLRRIGPLVSRRTPCAA